MLADDHEKVLIEPIAAARDHLEKLYEFDLMEDGGHIAGWLVNGDEAAAFDRRLSAYTDALSGKYQGLPGVPMVFAVGDGNHSLATAKACYEELKAANPGLDISRHPARYALVELENIHDDALVFAPIHRIVTGTDPDALLQICSPLPVPKADSRKVVRRLPSWDHLSGPRTEPAGCRRAAELPGCISCRP